MSSRYSADIRADIFPIFVRLSTRYRQISADIPFIDRNNPQVADIYLPIFSGFFTLFLDVVSFLFPHKQAKTMIDTSTLPWQSK
jgi:hypothetical protein